MYFLTIGGRGGASSVGGGEGGRGDDGDGGDDAGDSERDEADGADAHGVRVYAAEGGLTSGGPPSARTALPIEPTAQPPARSGVTAKLVQAGQPHDAQRHRAADGGLRQRAVQGVDVGQRLAVDGDDEVAGQEPGPLGRAAGLDPGDQHAGLERQVEVADDAAADRRRLPGHADPPARDVPVADEPAGDVDRRADGDGEADAPAPAR